ncbi:hypothetical protein ACSBR1_001317 [Camellia fascicularis]
MLSLRRQDWFEGEGFRSSLLFALTWKKISVRFLRPISWIDFNLASPDENCSRCFKVYREGTHLMIPWFERLIVDDVRARPNLVESSSGSHDLQMEIRKILTQRAASFNIALDDVSITGLTFGKEFTAATEAKQIAAEEAERAKFVVEKASRTREGEAKSAQLIGEAISKNQSFLTLGKIEVARDITRTISKSANRLFLNSDELLLNHQGMNSGSTSVYANTKTKDKYVLQILKNGENETWFHAAKMPLSVVLLLLSDFGLAITGGNQSKDNIKLLGTLGYVAPEYLLDGMDFGAVGRELLYVTSLGASSSSGF